MARGPISALSGDRLQFRADLYCGWPPGWASAAVVGVLLGLGAVLVSTARARQMLVAFPAHILRHVPPACDVPCSSSGLGATNLAVRSLRRVRRRRVYFVGTLNAVANLPRRYIEAAQTLGASRWLMHCRDPAGNPAGAVLKRLPHPRPRVVGGDRSRICRRRERHRQNDHLGENSSATPAGWCSSPSSSCSMRPLALPSCAGSPPDCSPGCQEHLAEPSRPIS